MPDPLSIRYNNPGAMEFGPFAQQYGATTDGRYAIFPDMDTGYRAMGGLLDTYQNKHGLNTVRGIVERWAPRAADNNSTDAYITKVARGVGVDPDEPLKPEHRPALMREMASYEAGRPVGTASSLVAGLSSPQSSPTAPGRPPMADYTTAYSDADALSPEDVASRRRRADELFGMVGQYRPNSGLLGALAQAFSGFESGRVGREATAGEAAGRGATMRALTDALSSTNPQAALAKGLATPYGSMLAPMAGHVLQQNIQEQSPMGKIQLEQAQLALEQAKENAAITRQYREEQGFNVPNSAARLPQVAQPSPSQLPNAALAAPAPTAPPAMPSTAGASMPGVVVNPPMAPGTTNPQPASAPIPGLPDHEIVRRFNAAENIVQTPQGPVVVNGKNVPLFGSIGEQLRAAQRMSAVPGLSSAAEARFKTIQSLMEQGVMPTAPGSPDQTMPISGLAEAKARQKGLEETATGSAKYYDSLHRGLSGSAMIAAQQKQNIAIAKTILDDPGFGFGSVSNLQQGTLRALATLGLAPEVAANREVFNQTMARILADQFSGLKSLASSTGEQGSRIFKPMLDIEEQAMPSPNDTVEGLKRKIDILDKAGDLMMRWGDAADHYAATNGRLDPRFDSALRSEIAQSRIPGYEGTEKGAPAAPGAPTAQTAAIPGPLTAEQAKASQVGATAIKDGITYRKDVDGWHPVEAPNLQQKAERAQMSPADRRQLRLQEAAQAPAKQAEQGALVQKTFDAERATLPPREFIQKYDPLRGQLRSDQLMLLNEAINRMFQR